MPSLSQLKRCGTCGANLIAEDLCPACMLDFGRMGGEEDPEEPIGNGGALPSSFGDYELIEEIARGGMGVVFKARQVSLNRVVAVKMILRGRFAGTPELARFRVEAETVASLHHANIVAIHEVGEHEGQPFFSMDYVQGKNLAQLVGNTPLPALRAAKYLKLVAEAVHYAHQHGVLHRDLKSSNILIDDADQPHVTDFGLAKRKEGDASITLTGQVLGSPNFMPPEQAAGQNNAFCPASDVYSLGAVLYQSLTGRPPFVAETMTATLRLVAESAPAPPHLLVPTVPHDLETICLKCLEKDPQRRYVAARDLAEELNRFLRDEPIRARPVGRAERFWRWCRRNRALAIAGAAVVLLLFMVAIGSPIVAFRLNRERQRAEAARKQAEAGEVKAQTEAAKSQQVAQLLENMLKGVGPSVALGRDTTMLREILDRTAASMGRDLAGQPAVEVELGGILARIYLELGRSRSAEEIARKNLDLARAHLGTNHLAVAEALHLIGAALGARGRFVEAEKFQREGLAMLRKLQGSENASVAASLNELGYVLKHQNRLAEAEAVTREALTLRRKLFGNERTEVADSLYLLALIMDDRHKAAEIEALHREALAIRRKLLGNEHPDVTDSLNSLGFLLRREGKLAEAETLIREALATRKSIFGSLHPVVAESLRDLALVLAGQGRLSEAETLGREAVAMQKKLLGNGHPTVAVSLDNLARVLQRQGKLEEVDSIYRELADRGKWEWWASRAWFLATCEDARFRDGKTAVDLAEQTVSASSRKQAAPLDTLAAAYAENGQFLQAASMEKEALALARDDEEKNDFTHRLKLYESNTPYRELNRNVLTGYGDFAARESLHHDQLEDLRGRMPADDPQIAATLAALISALLVEEKFSAAEPPARECLAIREKKMSDDWRTFDSRSMLGASLLGQKKFAEAEPLLLSGYEGLKQQQDRIPDFGQPHMRNALERLVQLYQAKSQPDRTAEWQNLLAGFDKRRAQKTLAVPHP